MKKVNAVLIKVFSVGVVAMLFAGGAAFLGYVAALCIGGETATAIAQFIYTVYVPIVIRCTSVVVGIGLITMYFSKTKALSLQEEKPEKE